MPYLNLDTNYFDHPKTRRLVGLLGPMADILPIRLWAYCAKIHPVDGSLKGYTDAEIEGVIHWQRGELSPGAAVKALVKVGFLKKLSTGYSCVDWKQHEGHIAAFSRRGKEANIKRWNMVRAGLPVGVQRGGVLNPPTDRTVPNQPLPTVPKDGPGDRFAKDGQRMTKALIAETAILMKPWHFEGDFKGVKLGDLPADYCQWAIKNLVKITPEERLGCEIVIKRKAEECAR